MRTSHKKFLARGLLAVMSAVEYHKTRHFHFIHPRRNKGDEKRDGVAPFSQLTRRELSFPSLDLLLNKRERPMKQKIVSNENASDDDEIRSRCSTESRFSKTNTLSSKAA